MNERLLTPAELGAEASFLRPLLLRPPWHRKNDKEDTGIRALFRRYRPGPAPHELSADIRGAVWRHAYYFPETLQQNEAARIRAIDHAALVLHLLARGPSNAPGGPDFGRACNKAGLTDARFTRLMGTPRALRLETLSRTMQRLAVLSPTLHWATEDPDRQSHPWNTHLPSTDEVWPLLNFLFGYDPEASIARWAAGFFGSGDSETPASEADQALVGAQND